MVGVLVLVDQHLTKATTVFLADIGVVVQQLHGDHDEVIEVHRIGGPEPTLIFLVGLRIQFLIAVVGLLGGGAGAQQLILGIADPAHHGAWRELLRVEVLVAQHQGHEPLGVGVVVDGEVAPQPELGGLGKLSAQDAHARGVEGAHPHRAGARTHQLGHPRAHLGGCLVGEGDGQDRAGMHATLGDQPGDPTCQHPGLTRARTGHHQHR